MAKENKTVNSEEIKVDEKIIVDKTVSDKTNALKNKTNQLSSSTDLLKEFEDSQLKKELPEIYVGDTVKVGVKITEVTKKEFNPTKV